MKMLIAGSWHRQASAVWHANGTRQSKKEDQA
jgi:hypothetical protein